MLFPLLNPIPTDFALTKPYQCLHCLEATDFALTSVSSGNVRLSEYYGEVVLINFWATWCGPCRVELPKLEALQQKYQRAGFSVIAVNVDSASVDVKGFLDSVDARQK